jgi:hypothetical protein
MGTASIGRRACRRSEGQYTRLTLWPRLFTAALICARPELPGNVTLLDAGEMLRDGIGLRAYCPVRGGVARRIRRRMCYPISRRIGHVKDEEGRSPNTQHPKRGEEPAMAMLTTPVKDLG